MSGFVWIALASYGFVSALLYSPEYNDIATYTKSNPFLPNSPVLGEGFLRCVDKIQSFFIFIIFWSGWFGREIPTTVPSYLVVGMFVSYDSFFFLQHEMR